MFNWWDNYKKEIKADVIKNLNDIIQETNPAMGIKSVTQPDTNHFRITMNDDTFKDFLLPIVPKVELVADQTKISWRYVGDTNWTDLVLLSILKGADGKQVLLQKGETSIQWRYSDSVTWTDLIEINSLKGTPGNDGKSIEMQKSSSAVQWRRIGDTTWIDVVPLADIKGNSGTDAKNPQFQKSVTAIQQRLAGDSVWNDLVLLADITGPSGKQIQLQSDSTNIQWKYTNDVAWTTLVSLASLKGDPGKNVQLQKGATQIQWRLTGDTNWIDLIATADLIGSTGKNIELQKNSTHVQWRVIGDASWTNLILLTDLKGDPGTAYNAGTPVAIAPVFGTPRQADNPLKTAWLTVMLKTDYTVTVAGAFADVIELRIGATATGLADGSGGIAVQSWETSFTGIALTVGTGIKQRSPICCLIPAGWYFCLRRVSGTNATIVASFSQPT